MEDAASEISDWEVLSASSACGGGGDDDEVLIISGGGGDVLLDHFALTPDPAAAFPGDGEGSWAGRGGAWQGLELLDGFDPIPEGSFDLAVGVRSQPPPIGGVHDAREEDSILQATLARGANQEEVVRAEIEQESNSVISHGELCLLLQPAHHGGGENLDSYAASPTGASLQSEVLESSLMQFDDGGISAGVDSSCLEDAVSSYGVHGEQQEQEQGSDANAATGCDEPDGEAKDGDLPLAHTPGTEGEKQFVVWWRLPLKLLHYCAWKVKPIWSFSIAAAFLGLVVLGRRMYKMKRKARGLPQVKIAFDDKRASQFADRAARLNEAFLVARRVPMLRTSSGATLPWSMVQDR